VGEVEEEILEEMEGEYIRVEAKVNDTSQEISPVTITTSSSFSRRHNSKSSMES
jgi:hypothetical protein